MSKDVSEFRRGWRVLVASALGVAFGASPVPFNSLGAFTVPLSEEFGWGRGEIQLAIFWMTVAVIIIVPIVGGLADRIGVRRVALFTLAGFGVTFALIGASPNSLFWFYGLYMLMGVIGGGSTPVSWTRAVNVWFVRNRGLALAFTLLGTGITAAFLPTLTVYLIEHVGWRLAYVGLALLPLAIALPVAWFWFREPSEEVRAAINAAAAGPEQLLPDGPRAEFALTLGEAMRTPRFWLLSVSIIFVTVGIAGLITNLQPLLIDKGFTAIEAAGTAGAIGVSIICGRLLAGYLIDRFWAPGVTFPMLALPAIACLVLTQGELSHTAAVAAAVMIGFAAGAETDLVAFLSARYFGVAHYGKIYGVLYAAFGLASGVAPPLFGRVFDVTGTYNSILYIAAGMFLGGAVLILCMGRYPK